MVVDSDKLFDPEAPGVLRGCLPERRRVLLAKLFGEVASGSDRSAARRLLSRCGRGPEP